MLKKVFELFQEAAVRWSDDKCHRMGASLAYYALFSIFPLLMLAVTGLGFFLGDDDATRAKIVSSFGSTGAPGAQGLVDQTLSNLQNHHTARGVGMVVGLVALVLSASGVFSELDTALSRIWRCPEPSSSGIVESVLQTVREKAMAMLLVLGAALLLLVSLILSTALSAVTSVARDALPFAWAWSMLEHAVSLGFLTFAFAALFKVVPACGAKWRDVLGGGLLTALLFTLAKRLLTLYMTTLASYDAYGAVGAVLALLTWIYLVSLIVFFGAEFARVYAERHGSFANRTALEPGEADETRAKSEVEAGKTATRAPGSPRKGERDRVADEGDQPHKGPPAHSLP
ncbi:YihY/virulence factor BrkB family protein [Pendulispora albinea]|uniref:YihY/virulence factor BrkB family protein n=1 Tax=Pendulispora albinea TaxID=2741071 RepID=A0ABZ2LNS9_9BACT